MAAPTESNDDLSQGGLRLMLSTRVLQVERLQTDVAAQAKVIEGQSLTIEDLKLAVTVRDAKTADQADHGNLDGATSG